MGGVSRWIFLRRLRRVGLANGARNTIELGWRQEKPLWFHGSRQIMEFPTAPASL
jgi:hypothetical protein